MRDVNKMTKRQLEQAAWMGKFEAHVVRLDGKHRGKIDWETAKHGYFTGRSEEAFAKEYVETRRSL